ncbi:hypothetical protein [Pandoraea faecigallinarum]|nr:hypothetical protein [Pandoraea faecigallinarum]
MLMILCPVDGKTHEAKRHASETNARKPHALNGGVVGGAQCSPIY